MLHGFWRSGSTYVWSRFRQDDDSTCYYEPLNERKATIAATKRSPPGPSSQAAHRHPSVDRPYDAEYLPLIANRGVPMFEQALAYRRYILDPDEAHPDLKRYLTLLIEAAQARGKRPVLAFNRTTTRIGWLKRAFDSRHLWIDRHPRQLWQSYVDMENRGNPYFLARWPLIIGRNATNETLKPIVPLLGTMGWIQRHLTRSGEGWAVLQVRLLDRSSLYQAFFYLWLLGTIEALRHADIVLDMENAHASAAYRKSVEREILDVTGLGVVLDDLRLPQHDTASVDFFAEAEAAAYRALHRSPLPWSDLRQVLESRHHLLSADKAALVRAAIP